METINRGNTGTVFPMKCRWYTINKLDNLLVQKKGEIAKLREHIEIINAELSSRVVKEISVPLSPAAITKELLQDEDIDKMTRYELRKRYVAWRDEQRAMQWKECKREQSYTNNQMQKAKKQEWPATQKQRNQIQREKQKGQAAKWNKENKEVRNAQQFVRKMKRMKEIEELIKSEALLDSISSLSEE